MLWRSVDRIVLMNEGRIAADMRPDTLLYTDLLKTHGIREPLYLTALRYAGVEITPALRPARISTLTLGKAEKAKVRAWFQAAPDRA